MKNRDWLGYLHTGYSRSIKKTFIVYPQIQLDNTGITY